MPYETTVRRRSGRKTRELAVVLEKPAEAHRSSEELTIQMDGREISAHVEIPISESNPVLYVA